MSQTRNPFTVAEDLTRLALDIKAIEQAMPTLEKMARIKLRNAMPGADKALERLSKVSKTILAGE
jgi:hypothetical protein